MKKIFGRFSALLLGTAMLTACGANKDELQTVTCVNVPETTEFVPVEAEYTAEEISGCFNAAFLKEALKENDNFVVSPLSAKLALNMAAVGAGEGTATEQELLNLFGYGSINELKDDSKNLMAELDREDGTITVNNSVWISDKLETLKEDYTQELSDVLSAESFNTDLTSADFVNSLNGWVNENTNGLIPQLLSQPLDESARLALVNTLYFNNEWRYKFESYATRDNEFYGSNGTETVPTMHNSMLHLNYGEGNKLKSLTLPYRDGSVMNVYLPKNEDESIAEIISELTPAELTEELDMKREEKLVNIALPKFECDYSGSLVEMMKLLGVSEAFDPNNAQFGKISDEQLYISSVIQAAKIKCDEKGTEAAAATMIVAAEGCAVIEEDPPIEFIADRPFMYEIKSPSGETLFMGVMQSFTE